MRLTFYILLFSFSSILLLQCDSRSGKKSPDDRLLAEVQSKKLYLSDLEGMLPINASGEDSTLIINALVERWALDAVLLNEAEMNVPKDLNIDQLVRDYRASLIKNNYESILIEQLLDSMVHTDTIARYYEIAKEQFSLEEPILRCRFIKILNTDPKLKEMKGWWKNIDDDDNEGRLTDYALNQAFSSRTNFESWYNLSEIALEMQPGMLTTSNLRTGKSFIESDDDFTYFFEALEVIDADEIPPLGYVKEKIKRVILHRRKQKLLKSKKEEMYAREMRRNNIKIYK